MMNSNNELATSHSRSSSQISIYNYPDHLNPFYEDDNHNRLRFWNLTKKNNFLRRRSFSIENIKELWSYRSFSLKKKSSTLGIHKTSESPPILRRNLALENTPLRMRNAATILSNTKMLNEYDRPQTMNLTVQTQQYRPPRSCSLTTLNPFETGAVSDISDNESHRSIVLGSPRKSYRKKSKAPSPPKKDLVSAISPNSVNEMNDSQNVTIDSENIDIKSLANEIEKFVSDTSNCELADTEKINKLSSQNLNTLESNPETNKFIAAQKTNGIEKYDVACDPAIEKLHVENIDSSLSAKNYNLCSLDLGKEVNLNNDPLGTVESLDNSYEKKSDNFQRYEIYSSIANENIIPIEQNILKNDLTHEIVCATNISEKLDNVTNHKKHNDFEKNCLRENNNVKREFLKFPLTIIEKGENKNKTKKSVQEIIDSINRSQQLLKESAERCVTTSTAESTSEPIFHYEETYGNTSDSSKIENNLFSEQNNINKYKITKQIFQHRESSPTTSNLDWNPLPKPKRINNGL